MLLAQDNPEDAIKSSSPPNAGAVEDRPIERRSFLTSNADGATS